MTLVRLSTSRPSNFKQLKRNNVTLRRTTKIPFRTPPTNLIQRKTFDFDPQNERFTHEENDVPSITEPPQVPIKKTNDNSKMHRVCYVTNWSRYRSGEAKFEIEYIDPFMCSHIIYAYATVDESKPEIKPVQKEDIGK